MTVLAVNLNRVAMRTKKGESECSADFSATLATGTMESLQVDEEQLAALPTAMAQACRRMIADSSTFGMSLGPARVPRLVAAHNTFKLESKREVLLDRVRVKKQEDKDHKARARLLFSVKLDAREEWPGRELLGKWLDLSLFAMREEGTA